MRYVRMVIPVLSVLVFTAQSSAPRTHRLEATPSTVAYGHYWSETKPVLRIASGDIIDVDTLLTSTPDRLEKAGVPAAEIQASLRAIVQQVKDRGPGGHILTGPVYVEGAEPGDALEVKVLSIDLPIEYGYNGCSGFVRENCTPGAGSRIIRMDRKRMIGHFAPGIEVPLRPFFGSMGVAPPPDRGRFSSNPPDIHAGNLDNKELVAGTTLWIPVHVPGALFEIGDGHAAQGDGEVDQTGIETSLRGRVQLTVRKKMTLTWPRAETPIALHQHGHRRRSHASDEDRGSGNDQFPRRDQRARQTHGLSVDQHCRRRRDHPARGRHDGGPRQNAQGHLQEMTGSTRRPRRIHR